MAQTIEELLQSVPLGVKVEYKIASNNVVGWRVSEMPTTFSSEEAKTLVSNLNSASLSVDFESTDKAINYFK